MHAIAGITKSYVKRFFQSPNKAQAALDAIESKPLGDHLAVKPPVGRSEIGTAVNQVVAKASGTVPPSALFSAGSIDTIWINSVDPRSNEAINGVIGEIAKAEHEVRIHEFAFEMKGQTTESLLEALAEKQRALPDFKVFIATSGEGRPTAPALKAALQEHGVDAQVAVFDRFASRSLDHSKSFIIDGRTGIIGGVNVQNHPEKDMLASVHGPIVDSILQDFDSAWKQSQYFYKVEGGKASTEGAKTLPPAIRGEAAAAVGPSVPMTFLSREAKNRVSEGAYANAADQGLLAALGAAKREVKITTPNCNDPAVWSAIQAAAERGVKVRLMLPRFFNQYRSIPDGANNDQFVSRFWAKLPEHAKENVELRWYTPDGHTLTRNHTKFMAVDGAWAYIGSQNMDRQSWKFSREAGLGIDDATETQKLSHVLFDQDWEQAVRVDPTQAPAPRDWKDWLAYRL